MTTASVLTRLTRLEVLVEQLTDQVPIPTATQLMQQAGLEPDPWQVDVLTSAAPRILLNCCRQSGKTSVAAALALATALRQPGALVLILSPSLRQSQESFRKVLDLYRIVQTIPAQAESALRLELVNASRIVSLPGTESTIRGYSNVRLLLVDEASRVSDELIYAVRPMLAVSQGRLIALTTPYGQRGWFFKEYTEGTEWERVKITAPDCPRISAAFLAQERATMPRDWYHAEYLCEFTSTDQSVFREEDLQAMFDDNVEPWDFLGSSAYVGHGGLRSWA